MRSLMSKIVMIDKLEPGMILSEPVYNNSGQVLIGAEAELNHKTIKVLKTWNIKSVLIKDSSTEENIEISEEILALAKQKVYARLSWEPRNSNEFDLVNTAVNFTARELLNAQV